MPRLATLQDAADLARIINDAFIVEAFFKIGDRTSAEEVAALMNGGGEFLVLDLPRRSGDLSAEAQRECGRRGGGETANRAAHSSNLLTTQGWPES